MLNKFTLDQHAFSLHLLSFAVNAVFISRATIKTNAVATALAPTMTTLATKMKHFFSQLFR